MSTVNFFMYLPVCCVRGDFFCGRGPLILRISDERLSKRIMLGNLEGAVRRGRGGKEKEWAEYIPSAVRAFGIAGDRKATALEAEVWVEKVTEGGRGFMAAWRK